MAAAEGAVKGSKRAAKWTFKISEPNHPLLSSVVREHNDGKRVMWIPAFAGMTVGFCKKRGLPGKNNCKTASRSAQNPHRHTAKKGVQCANIRGAKSLQT